MKKLTTDELNLLLVCHAVVFAYICFNLIARWLHWALFTDAYRWAETTLLVHTALYVMVCLPPLVVVLSMYYVSIAYPRLFRPGFVFFLLFFFLLFLELDVAWYSVSKQHITWSDVTVFLTESWENHIGLVSTDHEWLARIALVHLLFILLLFSIYYVGARVVFAKVQFSFKTTQLLLFIPALFLFQAIVGLTVDHTARNRWDIVATRHPIINQLFPSLWKFDIWPNRDLEAANQTFRSHSGDDAPLLQDILPETGELPTLSIGSTVSVLLVAIEGFNPNFVTPETMPFWHELTKDSVVYKNHYSTGNSTSYGVLGLLFGSPPIFYLNGPVFGSPYIDMLNSRGYSTKWIGNGVLEFKMEEYMDNFSRPKPTYQDDWAAVGEIVREISENSKTFIFVFYKSTHFPYQHSTNYTKFQPEAPGSLFADGKLHKNQEGIKNRYRNCLVELDDWLKTLTGMLDLEKTILILTGDHGEEMFENGRLSHSSSLDETMIRTPLLMSIPGRKAGVVTDITSHSQIMPSVGALLGWKLHLDKTGGARFPSTTGGWAVAAFNNHSNPPRRWAVISNSAKSILEGSFGHQLNIVSLRDRADGPVQFLAEPQRWNDNFRIAKNLQRALNSSTR